ncbi:MAG: bifunctional UDP-sugar hydrolase/5'-nucleotidase [Acidimicrobiia bacterium]
MRTASLAVLALGASFLPAAVGTIASSVPAGAAPAGYVAANDVRPAAVAEENIYRVLYSDGSIESFGAGGSSVKTATEPAAGLASGIGNNFLSVTSTGKVNPYEATQNWGSPSALPLNAPIVGVAQYPQGNGYWIVGGDGGVFAYNAAQFYGSTGGLQLNAPVIGIVNSPSGNGYWNYASDGGVFSFGDARFYGSASGISNARIVGMASTISGKGYWLLGADGGVFAFGDAKFAGSAVADLVSPAVGIAASNNGGYWILSADGGIYSYGGAPYQGRGTKAAVAISAAQPRYVEMQMLNINDFHGNLEPPGGAIAGQSVGGSEYLATQLKMARGNFGGNSITVTAGDNVGASPLISALFSDEPTIQSLNAMGVELAAVGNHEFDRGSDHLLRLANGGCAGDADACKTGPYTGASFQYLGANVTVNATGKTLFPASAIKTFSGVKVGFIGLTLKGTPDIVTPSGVAGLTFGDEITTINAQVPLLKAEGANAIVVLIHEGGTPNGSDFNACPNFSGAITAIAQGVDSSIKAIVSGHTHQPYNCVIAGKRVTSASSFGRVYTDERLWLDRNTGEVVDVTATNKLVTRDVAKDAAQTALIGQYKALSGPLEARVVGKVAGVITRTALPTGESPLGDLIADSQLAATAGASFGSSVMAFMNPGGIRADLPPTPLPADGSITYGNIFTVQPFGNSLVVKTMTGAQIQSVLEQQFVGCGGQTTQRILQISNGLTYTINAAATDCADKVTNLQLGGNPIEAGTSYRVTMNSFLADGGDGFTVFRNGTDQLGGALDLEAVEQYFTGLGSPPATVAVPTANRITQAT